MTPTAVDPALLRREFIRRAVETAPPLTPEGAAYLRSLLPPPTDDAADNSREDAA